MNKKIIIISIFGLILIGMVVGITYAYLSVQTKTNIIDLSKSGKLDVIYLNGEDINGVLYPAIDKSSGLSTTASIKISDDSVNAVAHVSLIPETLPNELAVAGLKWEVYRNNEITPFSSGTFAGVAEGSEISLVANYPLTTTETIFTVYVWLNGDQVGNEVMNKNFLGTISTTATTQVQ